jgi:class 3 adenylate cyclase
MGLKQDVISKVSSILDNKFSTEEISYVPDLEDTKLTFGNTGLEFEATVLFIDMRGSTEVLNKHNKSTVAKIHMSYFHTIVKIANSLGGQVRSFNGDSLLVFLQGTTKNTLSNAVKAAMQMKYMISNDDSGINGLLKKYTPIDFGIGIDDGKILCTKVGIAGTNNRDLIWVGNSVNKSVVLSDLSKSPNHIAISSRVYDCLLDDVKYGVRKNYYGQEEKVDMWTKSKFSYNNSYEYYYYTSWYWGVS